MELLDNLQTLLIENNIDVYIIPTNDYHLSEYVSDYFKTRAYISGFTGSAGTLVVTQTESRLWTDGRYYIQAERELANTNIALMKMGQPNVDTIKEYLIKNFSDGIIGFDNRVIETAFALDLIDSMPNATFENRDLISPIWKNRPELPYSVVYKLDEFFIGENFISKLNRVREEMKNSNADCHIISTLEDQAWLYNLRADDVKNTPVFLSFTIITDENIMLFINSNKLTPEILKYLDDNNIIVMPYEDIYKISSKLENKTILIDYNLINYNIYSSIERKNTLINKPNPILLMKAIKNETEIENTKMAHIRDGAAVVKAMYWLMNNINNDEITEISFSQYLESEREKQKGFIEPSFNTIAAFKEHGAMMHYCATTDTNYRLISDGSFFLVDSGGHYLEGTTDITRTFALGDVNEEMKIHYTSVLKGVINLTTATFLEGCNGINLDILARGPIWKQLIDYKCGTGHGVGHILSVHEAPNGIRWKVVPERNDSAPLKAGMITTNEPGIYLENQYGIRLENELLCVNIEENEWGHFLGFETLTACPFDINAINVDLLSSDERNWLNRYHQHVREVLNPYLTDEENNWLSQITKEI